MSERDGNDSVTYEGGRQHEKPSNRGGTAERLGKGKAGRKMSGKKDKLRQSKHGGQEVSRQIGDSVRIAPFTFRLVRACRWIRKRRSARRSSGC